MKCPVCNTEARIVQSENVLRGKELVRRMVYVCRNKTCQNFNKEVGKEEVQLDVTIEEQLLKSIGNSAGAF